LKIIENKNLNKYKLEVRKLPIKQLRFLNRSIKHRISKVDLKVFSIIFEQKMINRFLSISK